MAARLAQAIAGAEQGEDDTSERLIVRGRGPAHPAGIDPDACPPRTRSRQGGARRRKVQRGVRALSYASSTPPASRSIRSSAGGRWPTSPMPQFEATVTSTQFAATSPSGKRSRLRRPRRICRFRSHMRRRSWPRASRRSSSTGMRSHPGRTDWPFYVARAQLAYGVWLRRHRRMTESRAPLREAVATFDALGLPRYAERARRELRASGETVRRRAPGAWAQLSPQELQIAQLAADGLSNREIGERLYLSHRTVGVAPVSALPEARRHVPRAAAGRAEPCCGLLTKCSEST